MLRRYLILVCLVVALAVGLTYHHSASKEVASSRPSAPAGTLFDKQDKAVPGPREREVQSVKTEINVKPGERIAEVPPLKDEDRESRLGINAPPAPEEIFITSRRTLRWLGNVAAVTEDAAGGMDVLERRNGFAFVRVAPENFPKGALPVAFEARTGNLVVLTGKLSVQLKAAASVPDLSSEYSMDLVRSIVRLNLAIYQSSQPTQLTLTQLLTALRKDSRVVEADLEMIAERRNAQ